MDFRFFTNKKGLEKLDPLDINLILIYAFVVSTLTAVVSTSVESTLVVSTAVVSTAASVEVLASTFLHDVSPREKSTASKNNVLFIFSDFLMFSDFIYQ